MLHLYGELTLADERRDVAAPSLLSFYSAFFSSRTELPLLRSHTVLRDDGAQLLCCIRMEHHPPHFPAYTRSSVRVYTVRSVRYLLVQWVQREDHDAARLCEGGRGSYRRGSPSARADDPERPGKTTPSNVLLGVSGQRGYWRLSAYNASFPQAPASHCAHVSSRRTGWNRSGFLFTRPAAAARVTDGFDVSQCSALIKVYPNISID